MPAAAPPEIAQAVPLLADRPGRDGVTLYVCENFTCQAPLVGAEAAEKALSDSAGHSPQTSPSTSSAT
jgi:hypothetical protein